MNGYVGQTLWQRLRTWYIGISNAVRKYLDLSRVIPGKESEYSILCATLDAELDLLDRRINVQGKSGLAPTEFACSLDTLVPAGNEVWAMNISWPRDQIVTCERTGFHILGTQHAAMWMKFQRDFPMHYKSYRVIIAKGLFRTKPEVSGDVVAVTYYAYIPNSSLRGADRFVGGGHHSDERDHPDESDG